MDRDEFTLCIKITARLEISSDFWTHAVLPGFVNCLSNPTGGLQAFWDSLLGPCEKVKTFGLLVVGEQSTLTKEYTLNHVGILIWFLVCS